MFPIALRYKHGRLASDVHATFSQFEEQTGAVDIQRTDGRVVAHTSPMLQALTDAEHFRHYGAPRCTAQARAKHDVETSQNYRASLFALDRLSL